MAAKKDRWQELCSLVAQDDGLPVRDAGTWTEDKLYFWSRYLDITTSSMSRKPQWAAGLIYVDLFAGPGVCSIRSSGRRFPGSALIAGYQTNPFSKIIACELDKDFAAACEQRLQRSPAAATSKVIQGDCNERISEVASLIPDRALTLAFIDPESLHAKFATIETLTKNRRVDLLILFADRYDIVRNVSTYAGQAYSKLDEVLGPDSAWREKWSALSNQNASNVCKLFADLYRQQLRTRLDFRVFGEKVMRSFQGPLYRIIFASKHPRGLEFWEKVTGKDASGQREFDF